MQYFMALYFTNNDSRSRNEKSSPRYFIILRDELYCCKCELSVYFDLSFLSPFDAHYDFVNRVKT